MIREQTCGCRDDLVAGVFTHLCPDHDRLALAYLLSRSAGAPQERED